MNVTITPSPLHGEIETISSKSHAHRVLIAMAIAAYNKKKDISISTPLSISQLNLRGTSLDIDATKTCLEQLYEETPVMDCIESGSTFRFLLPITMALKENAVFLGRGRLPDRPMSPLKEEMEKHGCNFISSFVSGCSTSAQNTKIDQTKSSSQSSHEIFTVTGKMTSGDFTIPGNISSQFITGLLFALPLLKGNSRIIVTTPLESKGYVDMTLKVLDEFGVKIYIENAGAEFPCRQIYNINGGQVYKLRETNLSQILIEGDWSNAAFWLCAGALPLNIDTHETDLADLTNSAKYITCQGLTLNSTQGDKKIVEIIQSFGGKITYIRNLTNDIKICASELVANEVDVSNIPDLVPIISVLATFATGTTKITNAARVRLKECDRLSAMAICLNQLGGKVTELPEGLVIEGIGSKTLSGGTVDSFNDHRIAMAMAIASCRCREPLTITNAQAVQKSYPGFWEDFEKLGGDIEKF